MPGIIPAGIGTTVIIGITRVTVIGARVVTARGPMRMGTVVITVVGMTGAAMTGVATMFAIRTFTATARNGRKLPIAVAMAETGKK
jgi:hypothetical protein